MAEQFIGRRRIPAGSEEAAVFAKFVAPPKEPPRTLDRVPGDVFLRRRVGDQVDLAFPFRLPNGKDKSPDVGDRQP